MPLLCGKSCGFFIVKAYTLDTTGARMHARHNTLNRHSRPMDVNSNCPLGVSSSPFPLTSRHTAMVLMGASGYGMFFTDIAFECHRSYTIPYVG